MFWAIDRFGRSLIDLLTNMQHLEQCGVDLYLDQQNIDTTTPTGRLLFQVTGAFAEFERTMIKTRINLKLGNIKDELKTKGKFISKAGIVRTRLGRPSADADKLESAKKLLSQGLGIRKVAKRIGLGNSTVANLKNEMSAAA
jgi:DNA invertase Pin-like site-specific DNA recombinase